MYIVLDNIRSAHNVGTLFRVVDALGVEDCELLLSGYTPGPQDKYGLELKKLSKVSLGSEKTVKFRHFDSIDACLEFLSEQEVKVYCLELTDEAIDYFAIKSFDWNKSALILGNEVDGVSVEILNKHRDHIYIPMNGDKESLNVSVAASIVLFHLKNVSN